MHTTTHKAHSWECTLTCMGTHGHTYNTIALMNTRATAPATRNGRGCHCNGAVRVDNGSCCRSSRLVDRNVSMAPHRRAHSLVALACPRSRVCFGSRQRDAGRYFPACRGREYSARPVPFVRRHLLCAVSHVPTLVSSRHCVSHTCPCSRQGALLSILPLCTHPRAHSRLVIAFPTRAHVRDKVLCCRCFLCARTHVPTLVLSLRFTHVDVGDQVRESSRLSCACTYVSTLALPLTWETRCTSRQRSWCSRRSASFSRGSTCFSRSGPTCSQRQWPRGKCSTRE
jgi:hypothetical protein